MKLRIKGNEVYSVGSGGEVCLVYKLDSLRECAEVSHRGSSLRIVGFSDWRVQDIRGLIRYLETQERPALILYAGDDIGRFRPPYENLFEQLAGLSRYGLCAVAGNDDAPSARELISAITFIQCIRARSSWGNLRLLVWKVPRYLRMMTSIAIRDRYRILSAFCPTS